MTSEALADPLSQDWVGVTFTNPATGEEIEVREVGRDDRGEVLRARLTVQPGGTGPPRHVHPVIEEEFHVESGELTVWLDGELRTLAPGDSARVPPGTPHGFENRSDRPVVFEGVARPGLRLIHVLATLFGLAQDGEVDDDGAPGFLQAMVFAREMRDVLYLVSPPYPVQRALWTVFAPLGRALGYRATYDRYLRPAFWEDASLGQGSAGPGPGHQESHAGV